MSDPMDLYNMNDDMQDKTVDELVQKLEAMEKNNEQIKRENQLFESYLLRKQKEDRREVEDNQRNRGNKRQNEKATLTPDQKYEIASAELETLKANIEEGRDKSETLLERLKAILEGTDLQIAEIRKEAFDFGRFLSAAENGRIGKYDAEKLSKYMMDKLKQKETLIDKLQSKNVSLRVQISKAETQIKHKEEMGDDLKFIDFHSLQIENKQNVKNIDEKNKKLLKEKASAAETTAELQARRLELKDKSKDGEEMESLFNEKTKRLQKKRDDIQTTRDDLNAIQKQKKVL